MKRHLIIVAAAVLSCLAFSPAAQAVPLWDHLCKSHPFGFVPGAQIHHCDSFNALGRPCNYFADGGSMLCPEDWDTDEDTDDCYVDWGVRSCSGAEKVQCGIDMGLPGACGSSCQTAWFLCADGQTEECSSENYVTSDPGATGINGITCDYPSGSVNTTCQD